MTLKFPVLAVLLASVLSISKAAHAEMDLISFIWHNDAFVGTDGGGYTNGGFISWYDSSNYGEGDFSAPLLTRPFLSWLMPTSAPDFEVKGHTLGQIMVTPKDIKMANPDLENEAPYAGLAFFRSSYYAVKENYADVLNVTIGIVGPSSGAEQTQRFVHKVVGANDPQGWHHQLRDEPVGQLSRTRIWRYGDNGEVHRGTDFLVLGDISAGNLESSLGATVIARYGVGLQQSYATAAQLPGRLSNPIALDGGWYAYVGVGVQYVFNQIFVNGNTFRDSPSGDLNHEQVSVIAGVSYSWDSFSISLGYQEGNAFDRKALERQRFGSLALAWLL